MAAEEAPDAELAAFAVEAGLAPRGAAQIWTPLTGGVSSDIWRLDCAGRSFCLKRALAQLRTAAEWRAPVARNLYEWRWFETVAAIAPGGAPKLFAMDETRGVFAMEFLPPETHRLWKTDLLAGRVDSGAAAAVGDLLGRIHAATARDPAIAARFDTDAMFHALRLDSYLLASAARRPEAASALRRLAERTAATKLALVHGDVSPKNILLGPQGPVMLDAECAWYGDPAFDVAFCLNHLLLKSVVVPRATDALMESFTAFASAHRARVEWEPRADFELRAASLLPGLLLARIDGKSPVEYINSAADNRRVRAVAIALLNAPVECLEDVRDAWRAMTDEERA